VVDGSGLENRQGASLRGFESHPLRQVQGIKQPHAKEGIVCRTSEIRTPFDWWGASRAGFQAKLQIQSQSKALAIPPYQLSLSR
jgi:hypothetical protein